MVVSVTSRRSPNHVVGWRGIGGEGTVREHREWKGVRAVELPDFIGLTGGPTNLDSRRVNAWRSA